MLNSRHEKKLESNTPAPNAYNTTGLNPRGKDVAHFFVVLFHSVNKLFPKFTYVLLIFVLYFIIYSFC